MTVTFTATYNVLARFAQDSPAEASHAAYAWMQDNSAGQPMIALLQETARSDSLFWAETASPIELECYMLAAVNKMASQAGTFHGKHIKRLIASLWKKMSPTEQAAFLAWVEKNKNGEKNE